MPLRSRPPITSVLPLLAWSALVLGDPAARAQSPSPPTQASPPASASPARLELRAKDRLALVGNTLAERQQLFNHFETALLTRYATLELTVRNLGWSGDTPALQPRPLNFGNAATHLTTQRADVILAFFGLNESFAGEAGLAGFERDLETYLTTHRAARYNGTSAPRIALVSPIAHERLARLVHVDVDARNRELCAVHGRHAEGGRQAERAVCRRVHADEAGDGLGRDVADDQRHPPQ